MHSEVVGSSYSNLTSRMGFNWNFGSITILSSYQAIVIINIQSWCYILDHFFRCIMFFKLQRDARARKMYRQREIVNPLRDTRQRPWRIEYRSSAITSRTYRHVRQTIRPCLPFPWTGDPQLLIEIQTSIIWRTLTPLPFSPLRRPRFLSVSRM